MANCRITNIKPPCGYVVEGIAQIWMLDFDDFGGYRFRDNENYQNCYVTDVLRTGTLIELSAPDMIAKYSSEGSYQHTVETFVNDLSAEVIANLHLATKRRYVVVFRLNSGRFFTFGYEAGAAVSYQGQTAEGQGAVVVLRAASIYPLFELENFITSTRPSDFDGDFTNEFN